MPTMIEPDKHLRARIDACLRIALLSNCPRRQFGAVLWDPETKQTRGDSYNGAGRGAGMLCGGEVCLRDAQAIQSGTRTEIGCYHAEANLICNAAATGTATRGLWLIVTGEPCLSCAKLIHAARIARVVCIRGGYAGGSAGIDHLEAHGVEVSQVEGPQDPRTSEP